MRPSSYTLPLVVVFAVALVLRVTTPVRPLEAPKPVSAHLGDWLVAQSNLARPRSKPNESLAAPLPLSFLQIDPKSHSPR